MLVGDLIYFETLVIIVYNLTKGLDTINICSIDCNKQFYDVVWKDVFHLVDRNLCKGEVRRVLLVLFATILVPVRFKEK